MSIVRLGTAPRAAGLSYEDFQQHWSGQHAELAGALEGLRAYIQNHAVLRDGAPVLPYAGFDACSEIEFDTLDAMEAAFASEFYRSTVTSDEHALITRDRFMLTLAERRTIVAGDTPEGAVKLLTGWRPSTRSDVAELTGAMAGAWAEAVAATGAVKHDQLVAIEGAHDVWPGPVADVTDVLTFKSLEAAEAALAGPALREAQWRVAGLGQCVARLLARPVVVA